MTMKLSSVCALALLSIFIFILNAYSENSVLIEFFYLDPSKSDLFCSTCPSWQDEWRKFQEASSLIDDVQRDYGDQVQIERLDLETPEGREGFRRYNLTKWLAVVINCTIKVEGEQITRENLKWYIDICLQGEHLGANPVSPVSALFAFSLGLFSGFSPCLMAMLAFILSYASGTVSNFKSGMFRVLVFGIGFISAIMILGTLFATTLLLNPSLYRAIMWAVSILMILIGLNLVGFLKVPFSSKPFVQKLAQRYGSTTIGLFSLGFAFYFVNLCAAPLSFAVLPTLTAMKNVFFLALFCLGVLIPFLAVGILAGGSPTLAKRIREQHRRKIRAFSGVILLAYSVWLIVFYLL